MTAGQALLPVVVLISGSGTNLQALIDGAAAGQPYRICGVISNRPGARGLDRASSAGIPTRVLDHTAFADRTGFDAALGDAVESFEPGLVVLAGFMRILGDAFVERFAGRMLNIHPSLLPAFQGLHTHRRALEAGVSEHGASVHFVTSELDGGPVVAQVRVPVESGDTETILGARVLAREHELLPQVVTWFAEGRLEMRDGQIRFDTVPLHSALQC